MKRASAKVVRILQMMDFLRRNLEGVNAVELASRFHVHRATVYRDFETMKEAGIAIVLRNGKFYLEG